MTDKRARMKGRSERGKRFALIPAEVIHCANWAQASKPCRALVTDIAVQFTGYNNGDLSASISVLRPLGWRSPGTLTALLLEARHYGLLVLTRQGGLLTGASLYALGWKPIGACVDRHTHCCKLDDAGLAGTTPTVWRMPQPKFQRTKRPPKRKIASTPRVAISA
ncbi:MAG TPA: hypothetical protein VF292_07515 [Rhodanobacteraceae bacterium]